jgi:hypothetical protein
MGSGGGVALACAALFVQATVPLLLAIAAFRRRDW